MAVQNCLALVSLLTVYFLFLYTKLSHSTLATVILQRKPFNRGRIKLDHVIKITDWQAQGFRNSAQQPFSIYIKIIVSARQRPLETTHKK